MRVTDPTHSTQVPQIVVPREGLILPGNVTPLPTSPAVDDRSTIQAVPASTSLAKFLLSDVGETGKQKFKRSKQVLTYPQYLNEVGKNPKIHLRNTAQYMLDCIKYWDKVAKENGLYEKAGLKLDQDGKIDVLGYKVKPYGILLKPWAPEELIDKEELRGQNLVFNDFVQRLEILARMRHPNKMILFHGPNAVGKTRLFESVFEGMEAYSYTDEGVLYTYNWIPGGITAGSGEAFDHLFPTYKGDDAVSYEGYLNDLYQSSVKIPAGKNADPIFLLDQDKRVALIKHLKETGEISDDFNSDYIIGGKTNDLSARICNSFSKYYRGDTNRILRHIQVERWFYSSQSRRGLAIIQPENTSLGKVEEVAPEIDWNALPPEMKEVFRSAGVYEFKGDLPNCNRGIVVFDDMFKDGQMNQHLHLLRTAEKAKTTLESRSDFSVDEDLETVIVGTTNDKTLMAVEGEYHEWDSLRGRLLIVAMPFERRYGQVKGIFQPTLDQMIPKRGERHVAPHTLDLFAMWLTMTYLFKPKQDSKYYKKIDDISVNIRDQFASLASKLTLLEKALLYNAEDPNSYKIGSAKVYTPEQVEILRENLRFIVDEHNLGVGRHKYLLYEGGTGEEARHADAVFQAAILERPKECFTPLEVIEALKVEVMHGFKFEDQREHLIGLARQQIEQVKKFARDHGYSDDDLRMTTTKLPEFESAGSILASVQEHLKRQIKMEVLQAIGSIKPQEENLHTVSKYVEHARAFSRQKNVAPDWRDPQGNEQPNIGLLEDLENVFQFNDKSTEGRGRFRKSIGQKLGTWITETRNVGKNPHEPVNLKEIYPELLEALEAHNITKNSEMLNWFQMNRDKYFDLGGDLTQHPSYGLDPKPFDAVTRGMKGLKQMGYCDKCIPKVIDFALGKPAKVAGKPQQVGQGI